MGPKAPSEGTKVKPGKDAPVTQEGPGVVAADSLAAESQTFREANQAEPQQVSREDLSAPSKPHEADSARDHSSTGTGKSSSSSSAAHVEPAPTYVQNQYNKYPGGPHGKNIKEDDSIATEDKNKNASFSEFGTKNDPARAAEQKLARADAANPASTGGREKHIDGSTPYDALGRESEA
ncbi:hypothetical protein F4778DRAFT_23911 [Xylariomycetidae sp. FL2044]|nr:hypothetical protein F4778DRAFT_23911 [Xylariomycetidae sp. FL2044]